MEINDSVLHKSELKRAVSCSWIFSSLNWVRVVFLFSNMLVITWCISDISINKWRWLGLFVCKAGERGIWLLWKQAGIFVMLWGISLKANINVDKQRNCIRSQISPPPCKIYCSYFVGMCQRTWSAVKWCNLVWPLGYLKKNDYIKLCSWILMSFKFWGCLDRIGHPSHGVLPLTGPPRWCFSVLPGSCSFGMNVLENKINFHPHKANHFKWRFHWKIVVWATCVDHEKYSSAFTH